MRATVKVLRDAGSPLPRREIAARLGVSPSVAYDRLKRAVKARFVERLANGHYRAADVVPAF